jgi:hypothetical protein
MMRVETSTLGDDEMEEKEFVVTINILVDANSSIEAVEKVYSEILDNPPPAMPASIVDVQEYRGMGS